MNSNSFAGLGSLCSSAGSCPTSSHRIIALFLFHIVDDIPTQHNSTQSNPDCLKPSASAQGFGNFCITSNMTCDDYSLWSRPKASSARCSFGHRLETNRYEEIDQHYLASYRLVFHCTPASQKTTGKVEVNIKCSALCVLSLSCKRRVFRIALH